VDREVAVAGELTDTRAATRLLAVTRNGGVRSMVHPSVAVVPTRGATLAHLTTSDAAAPVPSSMKTGKSVALIPLVRTIPTAVM
jgi:hypothetical protein